MQLLQVAAAMFLIVDSYKINTFSIKKKFEETLILVAQYLLPLLHYFSIFLEPSFFGWYYCDIIKAENPTDFILIHQRTCGEEEKKASPSSLCSFFEQKFPWDRCLEKLLLGLWGCRRIFYFFALFFCGRMVDIHTTNW